MRFLRQAKGTGSAADALIREREEKSKKMLSRKNT